MNCREYVVAKLRKYSREDIILSDHTIIRIIQRQISEEDIIENILNPIRLEYAIQETAERTNEEKFDCYFGYSKNLCHRYVLVMNKSVIIVTAVKINRKWQRIAEHGVRR